ncbi:hypothetical protein B7494_g8593 [Chlorociboria aeruginascens]|nr:hypothetical protein B7494_g8593 [Chlorociboria aeruginascens]
MPPPPLPIVRRAPELLAPTHPTDLDAYRDTRLQYREEPRPRRPSSNRHSVSYDLGADVERVRVEPASSSRRRQSYYGQSAPSASTNSSGYEDKIREAASYQEEVAGPTAPLTAELLKKQQRQRRQAGSSRSTKSSGSRDESDYRKSATTRSSGPEDENVTIKVTGQARVVVRGAQIDCADGGEIEIKRQPKAIRNGSERSNSEYGGPRSDERRSRIDRPILSNATRTSSQHSYVRMPPPFAGGWL